MLSLPKHIAKKILAHAQLDHPIECCGVVARDATIEGHWRVIPMQNGAQCENFFWFESKQQLQVWREIDAHNEIIFALYHSHTSTQAYPSKSDIEYAAAFPDTFHLIASTKPNVASPLRAYRIIDGRVCEEPIEIINLQATVD